MGKIHREDGNAGRSVGFSVSERPQNKHLKPFPKGVSGNPSGKPKGLLRREDVEAMMGRFAVMTREQLQLVVQNQKSTMLEIMIASVMAKAAKDGDYARLQFLLDRSIGRVKDISEVHQHNHDAALDLEPRENVLTLLRQMRGTKAEGE